MDLFILQKSSLQGIDPATMEKNDYFRTPGKAIGTGPFIEKAYSAGQSMELARNDNYWRAKPQPRQDHPARVQGHDLGAARVRGR